MCSAQGQVLRCKLRHEGCNSAQRQVFHCKLRNLGCCFTRNEQVRQLPISFRTPSLASEQTLKDLKRGGEEWIWLTGSSGLHRNSPQGLNISSIRVFDQIRDPQILITLRPRFFYNKMIYIYNFNFHALLFFSVCWNSSSFIIEFSASEWALECEFLFLGRIG